MLVFVRGVGAVCVYDQPRDEATLVQMVSDWSKLALPEYHIDLISESSGVALLEPSRSIRRFLRFLQNSWQRRVVQRFLYHGRYLRGHEYRDRLYYRRYASCLLMLELNFHSGSSIYSNETDEWE
ncbi:hypothetical protein F2Q70_00012009 [Brassica cretica]|uniref:Uncharacterized protein n=1 Tax=Brassica cretica TaxID=69181 RepID=A0A3N6R458_BRACR|nr:hypothetical protein F2Q70_00012009 [Brassica cretica]KAF3550938.1 hypothetical protein DY000_02007723 [Brassica cretica]